MAKEKTMHTTASKYDTGLVPISLMGEIIDNGWYLVNTINPFNGECEFYTMLGKEVVHLYFTDAERRKIYMSRNPIEFEEEDI